MDVTIRQSPAFAVARCKLASGEGMKADAGAMMAHSIGVELEAKVQGGLMKGLKRSILGGESLFHDHLDRARRRRLGRLHRQPAR